MTVDVDKHLDAVLRASGSALRHYTMQSTLDAMRVAMCNAMRPTSPWFDAVKCKPLDGEYVWASWTGIPGAPPEPMVGLARYVPNLGWQPIGCMGWDWMVTIWTHVPQVPK